MSTGLKNPTEKAPYLLWKEDDTWIAKDGRTGISSQGESRRAALDSLDEAVTLYRKEIDDSIDLSKREREVLENLDIDPSEVKKAREDSEKLPDFMQWGIRRQLWRQLIFSGREIVKALTQNRFYIVGRTGSHVKLRYEHQTNADDVRIVIVPMHDSIKSWTLRSIADRAGAKDFQKFKDWIDRSL